MGPLDATKSVPTLRKLALLLRVVPFALLAGYGYSTSVTWVTGPPRLLSPRAPESVEIFAGASPARPHVGVAVIEIAEVSGSYASRNQELMSELRREAGAQGCDAIQLNGFVNKGVGVDAPLVDDLATGRQGVSAVCLVYTDVPGSEPSAMQIVAAPGR